MAIRCVRPPPEAQRAIERHDLRVELLQWRVFENSGITFPHSDRTNSSQRGIQTSFDCSDPTSVHSCPGRAPEGRYDLAYSAGCACGLSTSGYALNGCVVVSSLVRLNGSHELAQRVGMYSPLVGGRFSASSWFSTVADVTEEGKSYSRPAAPKDP